MWLHLPAVVAIALCLVAHASAVSLAKRDVSPYFIETGPDNTVVLLDSANSVGVTLACRVSTAVNNTRVQWIEYGTVQSGNTISDGNLLLPGHPNFLRYSLDLSLPGQYDLHIFPVEIADGTFYTCQDFNAAPPDQRLLGAQLVVIEALPNCTTTMTSQVVVEGDYFTMECIMFFRASVGVEPLMTWIGPEPFQTAYTVTNVSIWSGMSFTANRDMNAQSFSLLTNFTQKGFNSPDAATNIPNWNYTSRFLQMFVNWGPKNMYATPDQETYDVGTVITCFADAFPAATIYWQNMDTAENWYSQSFTVRADMVGSNRMRCHAENYINNILYYNDLFVLVTVNPIPTTPSPGPSTTTTMPPAEAYCSDLTGRWQSDNPKASLCIWIDFSSNGVVTGLLRNDTDTYWLDIYGRVQVNTFDQGGFTTVAPGTIGVTAYVLECKACFGVETMTVSQLQRSAASAASCGDPGVSLILPQFSFYRVANTPPCNSPPPAY